MHNKSILVTGCAGFIGSHLVDKLLELGHSVIGVDNLSNSSTTYLPVTNSKFKFYCLDFSDQILLVSILNDQYDYVFHLAAESSVPKTVSDVIGTSETNIFKAIKLLDTCSRSPRVKRFIFSSSSAVYENSILKNYRMHENLQQISCLSPYAIQKYTVEKYCKYFSLEGTLDCVSLRYFNVYGTRQTSRTNIVSGWLTSILKDHKKSVPIYGNSNHTRDYIHVSTVVDANIAALTTVEMFEGSVVNVGSGQQYSIEYLKEVFIEEFPDIKFDYLGNRIGDASHTLASIENMESFLKIIMGNYKPFKKLLKETIQYYKKECKHGE